MKTKSAVRFVLLIVLGLAGSAVGEGQDVKVKITDVKVDDSVYTPFYEVNTEQDHEQGAASRWIRLGVYFTTEGGWIDEIDIAQIAAIKKNKDDESLMFCEKVHYINLEPGDHTVYVYLHPSYVKRYDIDAFDVDAGVTISIAGKVVAEQETTRHYKKGWAASSAAKNARGYLLNHTETPFWFINYDFLEIIKREAHSGN